MNDQETIELDLTLIEGIGGESIVLRITENVDGKDRDSFVKAAPCGVEIEGKIGFNIDSRIGNNSENIPELISTDFEHMNIIKYWRALGQCGTPGFGSPEQFMGKVHVKSDNYAYGKMAIIILFPWDIAWDLLSKQITKKDLQNENVQHFDFHNSISKLLDVNRNYFKLF